MSGKANEHEWTSVSDLMASFIAVLIIFVMAMLMARQPHRPSDEEVRRHQVQLKIDSVLQAFAQSGGTGSERFFDIDTVNKAIILRDSGFASGQPCMAPEARVRMEAQKSNIEALLHNDEHLIITIEGHADCTPLHKNRDCTCDLGSYQFSDNVTLSLARAQQTRDILVQGWDNELTERVAVNGYGATRPLIGKSDRENRRVVFKIERRTDTTADSLKRHITKKI